MLADLRVLDFTTTIAGPHATRLLADLGARVVKIESTEGDLLRHRPPIRQGASSYFGALNAGKRSMVVDLKRPEGVAVVRRLVARSDLVVENFRPGVMARLGLGYRELRAIRADLVYCAMSGYGQTGPSAGLPAYAPSIHAASGYDLAHLSYQGDRGRPDACGVFVGDVLLGTYAFGAIMTALFHRRATGEGQMIDVSMLESMLTLMLTEVQRTQFPVPPPGRPMFGPLQTRDGYVMLAVASERTFADLCGAAGHEEWRVDPRFARYADRRANWHLFIEELEGWSRQLTTAECQARFDEAGVPASPYRTVDEALADPQLTHRQALGEVRDGGGTFRAVNPPYRFSAAPAHLQPFAPALGEHTDEILAAAGYARDEIAALRQAQVVA
ncbi:MAG TPA: CoA transferase [Candidatus Binatia bacterium]|nr:CoA transferase [Candidatus Binatia bacterium]